MFVFKIRPPAGCLGTGIWLKGAKDVIPLFSECAIRDAFLNCSNIDRVGTTASTYTFLQGTLSYGGTFTYQEQQGIYCKYGICSSSQTFNTKSR